MARRYRALIAAAVLVLLAARVETQALKPAWHLVKTLASGPGFFGLRVDIQGDVMVVGSPSIYDLQENVDEAGSVTVYRRVNNQWVQEWRDRTDTEPNFIAIDGDTFAVANSYPSGELEIYERSGGNWSSVFHLSLSSNVQALAISGNTVALGIRSSTSVGCQLYVRNGGDWTLQQTLSAAAEDVDIDGDTLVLPKTAGVNVYSRFDGVWTRSATISDARLVEFGDVAIRGDRLVARDGSQAFGYRRIDGVWTQTNTFSLLPGSSGRIHIDIDDHQVAVVQREACYLCEVPYSIRSFMRTDQGWSTGTTYTTPETHWGLSQIALDSGHLVVGTGGPNADGDGVRVYSNIGAEAGPDLDVVADAFGVASVTLTGQVNASVGDPRWTINGVVLPGLTATFTLPFGEWTATFSVPTYGVSDETTVRVALPEVPGAQGPRGPVGATGATGAAGAAGVNGATGGTGAIGTTGSTGQTGAAGATGSTGASGPPGAEGPQGAQGAIGPTGPSGTQGDKGPIGDQGPPGLQGPQGPYGTQGPGGAAGAQGASGNRGDKGENGVIGPAGPTGFQGPDGGRGNAGATGAGGPIGERGNPGTTGAPGSTGSLGATGVRGEPGAVGARGDLGGIGPQGHLGPQGAIGNAGDYGITGERGDAGAPGETGLAGPVGPKGASGATGPDGARGSIGDSGAQGSAGLAGAPGPTGPPERPDLTSIVFMLEGDRPPAGYVAVGAFWEERIDVDGPGGQPPRRLRIVMWRKQ